jgi:tetratricopeptide (TPR) repeat protein
MGSTAYFRPPLYPYFLAALYALFGIGYLVPTLIQILLGVFNVLWIYYLGCRLFSSGAGTIAAVASALYPPFLFFDVQLMIPPLAIFLSFAALWAYLNVRDSLKLRWAAISGLLWGLASITRANFALGGFVFFLFSIPLSAAVEQRGRRLLIPLCFLVTFSLPIATVTVRNALVVNDFIPISSNAGLNFYIGNRQGSDGMRAVRPGYEWEKYISLPVKELGERTTPGRISRFWYGKAFDEIRHDLSGWIALMGRKCYLLFQKVELRNNLDYPFILKFSPPARFVDRFLHFGVIAPLGIVGMMYNRKRWNRIYPLYLYTILYSLSVVLFFVCSRYRLPIVYALMMFAGDTVIRWVQSLKNRRWRGIVPALLCAIMLMGVLNADITRVSGSDEPRVYYWLGFISYRMGDMESARRHLTHALELDDEDPDAWHLLGKVHEAKGEVDRALEFFGEATARAPDFVRALDNSGNLLVSLGRFEEAIPLYERAIEHSPNFMYAYVHLASTLEKTGRTARAIWVLRKCLTLFPDYTRARLLLESLREPLQSTQEK